MIEKSIHISIILLLFSSLSLNSQIKFNPEWLDHPGNYTKELESCFEYKEIPVYASEESIYLTFLKNGYASAVFENPEKWITNVSNRRVKQITIVFSKYPYFKEDWITNYHLLLSRRLKSLFQLDPTLNSAQIEWKLLVQTNCKTEEDALKLLHGIVIKCEYIPIEEIKKQKIAAQAQTERELPKQTNQDSLNENAYREQYWDSFYKHQTEWQQADEKHQRKFEKLKKKEEKKRRKKLKNSQKCPNFNKKRPWWKF